MGQKVHPYGFRWEPLWLKSLVRGAALRDQVHEDHQLRRHIKKSSFMLASQRRIERTGDKRGEPTPRVRASDR